jgi:hypothetical protein
MPTRGWPAAACACGCAPSPAGSGTCIAPHAGAAGVLPGWADDLRPLLTAVETLHSFWAASMAASAAGDGYTCKAQPHTKDTNSAAAESLQYPSVHTLRRRRSAPLSEELLLPPSLSPPPPSSSSRLSLLSPLCVGPSPAQANGAPTLVPLCRLIHLQHGGKSRSHAAPGVTSAHSRRYSIEAPWILLPSPAGSHSSSARMRCVQDSRSCACSSSVAGCGHGRDHQPTTPHTCVVASGALNRR